MGNEGDRDYILAPASPNFSNGSLGNAGTSIPHYSLLVLVWTSFSAAFLFVVLYTVVRFNVSSHLSVNNYFIFLALATLLILYILKTI
ncbi:hypothetical protein jhhlp_006956 [Lomentospora prolificans]|uniref:Uncharacterized protein n=1 Tax=Lomentospora prolificans TaxID=41688 RepID=A0A2N3N1A7_9PEZI|nr:hypothetical protein jhhlp_006956 [Lomentospora prolificans]